jgi:hypothetical protein
LADRKQRDDSIASGSSFLREAEEKSPCSYRNRNKTPSPLLLTFTKAAFTFPSTSIPVPSGMKKCLIPYVIWALFFNELVKQGGTVLMLPLLPF